MRYLLATFMCVTVLTLVAQQPGGNNPLGGDDPFGSGGSDPFAAGGGDGAADDPVGVNEFTTDSGQGAAAPGAQPALSPPPNPFQAASDSMSDMDMEMGMEMEGGGMGGPPAGEMMMEDMMMGGMGGGMMAAPNPEDVFQNGLQRAIRTLRKTDNPQHKTALKGYIKTALEQRYTRMIEMRRQELQRLRDQLTNLDKDLQRRQAAKNRVIEVQMKSVELAAEGLLELGDLQRRESGEEVYGGYGGGYEN